MATRRGWESLNAPPPRAIAAVESGAVRLPRSTSLPRSSSAPTLNDCQVGFSPENLGTPRTARRGVVPVGLHAQRPDGVGERGRASSSAAKGSASIAGCAPTLGPYTGRDGELQDRCRRSAGVKQEAPAVPGGLGIPPGIDLASRRHPGTCSPRSSSQQHARSASHNGMVARSWTRMGELDISGACTKGQGSCSPRLTTTTTTTTTTTHSETLAHIAARRERSFEHRKEGMRLASSDIDAVPRSAPGTCSPRQVRSGLDPATNLVGAEARLALRSATNARRSATPQRSPRSVTPRRSPWPLPEEYLAMIGVEPSRSSEQAHGRTSGVPRLAGTVLTEVRASVPRPPSRERDPALHELLRQGRMKSGPPPPCSSARAAVRIPQPELDLAYYSSFDSMMEKQASTGSSSCDDAGESQCPTSARMTDRQRTSTEQSMASTRSCDTGTQEARIAAIMNEGEYDDVLIGPFRASPSQCSTAWSSIATDAPGLTEDRKSINAESTAVPKPERPSRK